MWDSKCAGRRHAMIQIIDDCEEGSFISFKSELLSSPFLTPQWI